MSRQRGKLRLLLGAMSFACCFLIGLCGHSVKFGVKDLKRLEGLISFGVSNSEIRLRIAQGRVCENTCARCSLEKKAHL